MKHVPYFSFAALLLATIGCSIPSRKELITYDDGIYSSLPYPVTVVEEETETTEVSPQIVKKTITRTYYSVPLSMGITPYGVFYGYNDPWYYSTYRSRSSYYWGTHQRHYRYHCPMNIYGNPYGYSPYFPDPMWMYGPSWGYDYGWNTPYGWNYPYDYNPYGYNPYGPNWGWGWGGRNNNGDNGGNGGGNEPVGSHLTPVRVNAGSNAPVRAASTPIDRPGKIISNTESFPQTPVESRISPQERKGYNSGGTPEFSPVPVEPSKRNPAYPVSYTERTPVERTPVQGIPTHRTPSEPSSVHRTPAQRAPSEPSSVQRAPEHRAPAPQAPRERAMPERSQAPVRSVQNQASPQNRGGGRFSHEL